MKNYITLIMIILFANFSNAQDGSMADYAKAWQNVQQLENEGLTKSALEVVKDIAAQALKENNTVQRIKSLVYLSRYALVLEEDAQLKIVNDFKTEIERSNTVTRHLLENMLATMYWQYFQQNRYRFYDRTKTREIVDAKDFRTWDLETLFNEIHLYYQKSLENGLLLQQEPLENYNELLIAVKNSKTYRPTLYDLLSHNALLFYKTDEHSITKPTYQFKIEDSDLLSSGDRFMNITLNSKDSTSLQLNAIKIYQNLLKAHHKDHSKAYVDVDLERLNYIQKHAVVADKEARVLETLQSSSQQLGNSPLSGLYQYEIAKRYKKQGNRYVYDTKNESLRWKLKDALKICNTIIEKYPSSEGAKRCEALKEQLLNPSLQLQSENHIPLLKKSRILVSYTNLETLNFSIYKISKKQLDTYNKAYNTEDKEALLKRLSVYKTWKSQLKNENDLQRHQTEIIVPELENGLYIITARPETAPKTFAEGFIQATNFALIEGEEHGKQMYQVIDRNSGKPIEGAKVDMSYALNDSEKTWTKSFTTDRYGRFEFKKDHKYYRNVEIIITADKESGYFGNYYIYRLRNQKPKDHTDYRAHLFSDRSIYRPGQTIYFKGIATKTYDKKTEIAENTEVTISLYDANRQKISELKAVTNDYGSFHGKFIISDTGLTGSFRINASSKNNNLNANHYFSVEAYKRPKFKTEFLPITETFKINDDITVTGHALAFAGSHITDAKVVYRVKRNVQFPRWYYWRAPYRNYEAQEITHGETTTNAKGEFEITFKAIPDDTANKTNLPIFRYEVTADVTDINGETRSTTTVVNVGYHSMTINIVMPEKLDKTKKTHEITIASKNLNGEYAPAKGTVSIYKLEAPDRVLRHRPWNSPDYQVISETDFKTFFPNDPYGNEDDLKHWKKGKRVFTADFDTEQSKIVTVKRTKKWDSGKYIVVVESEDPFDQPIKDETYVTLYSDKDPSTLDNALFSVQLDKDNYTTNSMAKVTFASAAQSLYVTVDIEKAGKIISTQVLKLNNSKATISIPVNPEDVGGFRVNYSYAAFNQYGSQSLLVPVAYPKTDLQIETKTFRDQLKPGQDETWSFTIKGPMGDKVSAELLASMYDASLDEFKSHDWYFNPFTKPIYNSRYQKRAYGSFRNSAFRIHHDFAHIYAYPKQAYDQLNWFGFYFGQPVNVQYMIRGQAAGVIVESDESAVLDETNIAAYELKDTEEQFLRNKVKLVPNVDSKKGYREGNLKTENHIKKLEGINSNNQKQQNPKDFDNIQIRKNLQETAFFFPQLQTDAEGHVSFNFTAPEAMTTWKLQLLAHTKSLESAVTQLEAVTQKELMVIPNAPRFLRTGDKITISSKIANLTDKVLNGKAKLELTDPVSGKSIDAELSNSDSTKTFTIDAKGNTQVSWNLSIPDDLQAVQYKVLAVSDDFSDGEQNALPVLSNRMLVTETMTMWVRSNETRTFTLDKLKANTSNSLKHHKLTLEITSNPAWYAVQALPYLMEYPYECNEQTFSRYYANTLAQHIVSTNPKIEAVFDQWKSQDALLSNLEKNQELKSLLIEETPWLRDAQSETEQKKRIALLFDLNTMKNELQKAKQKLQRNQSSTGGWAWFNGGRTNRFITQHILAGFGHLKQLNVAIPERQDQEMIARAIVYLDQQFVEDYERLTRYHKDIDLSKDHLSYMQMHYLYVRSFFPELKASKKVKDIMAYYHSQIKSYWLSKSLYAKGLMALTAHRLEDTKTANKILRSLKENSITSDELGMYWKENTSSWYWYQAPIETQALMIEAFSEIENDTKTIDNLKIWLLKNKQTNKWETTKATTEAVYALLLQGSDWLSETDMAEVTIGGKQVSPETLDNVTVEAGTGYYKTSWNEGDIQPDMAEVTLTKKGEGIAWGGVYWQYFEDLDKITSAETPLKLKKKLFLKSNTDTGEVITEIDNHTTLNVGDLIKVRIELRADRPMEFVHMKDMRASGLEPIDVLSKYKWQDGLGYYQSTRDAATHFFFDYLPKGVYVFEYDLRVNNAGDMSNGITTIQNMYAPEFSSHSEGIRITVD